MKNNLKLLRTKHRFTQEELAQKLGVTRQTINAIEKGKYLPSLSLAFNLSVTFNTSIEKIFKS